MATQFDILRLMLLLVTIFVFLPSSNDIKGAYKQVGQIKTHAIV